MLDKKQDPWITRQARELRPHIVWDSIKESAKWLVAMAGGLVGIWQWLQHNWNAATAILVWVLSLVILLILSRIEQRSYDKRVVRVFGKIEQEYAQQMSILLAQHQEKTDELLTRLKELQKDSASMAQQQQREIDGLRQEMQPVIVNDAAEIWNPHEQEVRKQWESLNAGARDVLAFMVRSGALPPEKVFAYLDQQGYQEKVFRKVQQTGLVLGLKDTYVVKFELKPYLDRIIAFENSNLANADILRVRNTQKGIGDNAESPAWDIRKQDAHRQWSQLNAAQRALVRFVLIRGTATAAQIFTFADQEGLNKASEIWAWVMAKTGFLLGDSDSGFRINPELKPYLEQIIAEDKSQAAHS